MVDPFSLTPPSTTRLRAMDGRTSDPRIHRARRLRRHRSLAARRRLRDRRRGGRLPPGDKLGAARWKDVTAGTAPDAALVPGGGCHDLCDAPRLGLAANAVLDGTFFDRPLLSFPHRTCGP